MMIRGFVPADYKHLVRIHQEFYEDEFELPDLDNIIKVASMVDENDEPVAFGILRPIAEAIMIADKSLPRATRVKILTRLIGEARFLAHIENFSQMHSFVQDKGFEEFLVKHFGFRTTKGQALVTEV